MRGGRLVGIDEYHVVAACFALGDEFVQRDDGGLQVQRDFVGDACALPVLPGDGGVGYVDVAAGELRVLGQGERDGGAAVSSERADFQIIFYAHQPCEPCEQGGLLGGDGHFTEAVRCGVGADLREYGMFGFADLAQIGE